MNLKTVSEIKGTNQNKTGERELLAVSFGTSYKNTSHRKRYGERYAGIYPASGFYKSDYY